MQEVPIIVCETWVNFPTGHFSPPSEPHKTYTLPGVNKCATTHGIYIYIYSTVAKRCIMIKKSLEMATSIPTPMCQPYTTAVNKIPACLRLGMQVYCGSTNPWICRTVSISAVFVKLLLSRHAQWIYI